jgi:hypothetical protein
LFYRQQISQNVQVLKIRLQRSVSDDLFTDLNKGVTVCLILDKQMSYLLSLIYSQISGARKIDHLSSLAFKSNICFSYKSAISLIL